METGTLTHEQLKEYYGKTLQHSDDLATNACCCAPPPPALRAILAQLDPEIVDRFYGCGSPIPPLLEGCTALDLGCGTGRDVYILSRLVGPAGRVIGVDMTDAQIEVGIRHIDSMTATFGYPAPNVEFRRGYIEDLAALGIADDSIDLVVSNCVVNLSPRKPAVFAEVFRVLKPGGELYFSDVFADRRIPAALLDDPVLYGECLSGALYDGDFRRLLAGLGCPDARCTSSSRITIDNPEVEARIGMIGFQSRTVRAFKVDGLEDRCEDYGQVATYRGTIPDHPHAFRSGRTIPSPPANRSRSAATPRPCSRAAATARTSPSPATAPPTSGPSPARAPPPPPARPVAAERNLHLDYDDDFR